MAQIHKIRQSTKSKRLLFQNSGVVINVHDAEKETCSKIHESPPLTEDVIPLILPDLQNGAHCSSEINTEPVEDDQYPNLSIQTADIILDSPGTCFNIPSPFPPVICKKNKRKCENKRDLVR